MRFFDANSNYHGLQLQADRRFSGGLFLNVNYTFSKALDTQSGNADFSRIDANDKAANYGPANYDRRHIFNLNWVYELPRKESAGRILGGIINDWQLSGGYRLESGAALRRHVQRQRREQPERDRFTLGRLPAGDQRRSGQGLFERPVSDDRHERLLARAGRQHRTRIGPQLPESRADQRARSVAAEERPVRRLPRVPGALRRVQRAEADQETVNTIPAAATNVWWIDLMPGEHFTYNLRRMGSERFFSIKFDLKTPVKAPGSALGLERLTLRHTGGC